MNRLFRAPVALALCGLLAGCVSETSNSDPDNPYVPVSSSSSAVPDLELSADGVGSINAATPYSSKAIAAAIPGFRVETVQATSDGKVKWILAAFGEDGLQMLRFENAGGKVGGIQVVSEGIPGPRGIRVGTTYGNSGASRMRCKPGSGAWVGMAVCSADGGRISYVFAPSEYFATPGKLPPRDILNESRLVRMVWRNS